MAIPGAAVVSKFKMFTTVKYVSYAYLITIIVLGVLAGGVHWYKTGDYKPFVKNTGGVAFAADYNLYNNVQELTSEELHEQYPEKYTFNYMNYLREASIKYLVIMILVIMFVYKFYDWIIRFFAQGENNAVPYFIIILLTLTTIALMEFAYVAVIDGEFTVPFRGLYAFARNIFSFFQMPDVVPDVVGVMNSTMAQ